MNVNANDASCSTPIAPSRADWRSSLLWNSTVLAGSLVLLSLESGWAAESAQASTSVGDRPTPPSLKTEAVLEADAIEIAADSPQKTPAQLTAFAQPSKPPAQAAVSEPSEPHRGSQEELPETLSAALQTEAFTVTNPEIASLEIGAESEDESLEEAMPASGLFIQSNGLSNGLSAELSALAPVLELASESALESALEPESVDAALSLELGGLHTEERHESESAEVVEYGEAFAEESPDAAPLRTAHATNNTAENLSQVLSALQAEFFTSAPETAWVSSSSGSLGELTEILAALEAEFFTSEGELDLAQSYDAESADIELAETEYSLMQENSLSLAREASPDSHSSISANFASPQVTVGEAIAPSRAEAEPDWQPLVWDCDTVDCYELTEADLASLPESELPESELSESELSESELWLPQAQAQTSTQAQISTEISAETLAATLSESEVSAADPILLGQAESVDGAATSGSALILGTPYIQLQGAYVLQGDESSARARATVLYPTSPNLLFGATVDLAGGEAFGNADGIGLDLTELYATFMPPGTSGLRFTAGLMDLTSYFDRNSFAKDVVTHFFNPVFQTNPALSAAGLSSRIGAMASWNPVDSVDVRAAVFSSNRDLSEFALDAFAGEVGFRAGNLILRGSYISAEDPGSGDGFEEIFGLDRGDVFGVQEGDREEAFGLNAEYFIPEINLGLFARYGHYTNRDVDESANTYSFGLNLLDVFMPDDRLGLAYGRGLSNDDLRRDRGDEVPDVLELFYDFRLSPNLRAGATVQQRDQFSDTVFGFRVRADLDVTGLGRLF